MDVCLGKLFETRDVVGWLQLVGACSGFGFGLLRRWTSLADTETYQCRWRTITLSVHCSSVSSKAHGPRSID